MTGPLLRISRKRTPSAQRLWPSATFSYCLHTARTGKFTVFYRIICRSTGSWQKFLQKHMSTYVGMSLPRPRLPRSCRRRYGPVTVLMLTTTQSGHRACVNTHIVVSPCPTPTSGVATGLACHPPFSLFAATTILNGVTMRFSHTENIRRGAAHWWRGNALSANVGNNHIVVRTRRMGTSVSAPAFRSPCPLSCLFPETARMTQPLRISCLAGVCAVVAAAMRIDPYIGCSGPRGNRSRR